MKDSDAKQQHDKEQKRYSTGWILAKEPEIGRHGQAASKAYKQGRGEATL